MGSYLSSPVTHKEMCGGESRENPFVMPRKNHIIDEISFRISLLKSAVRSFVESQTKKRNESILAVESQLR